MKVNDFIIVSISIRYKKEKKPVQMREMKLIGLILPLEVSVNDKFSSANRSFLQILHKRVYRRRP